MHGFLRSFLSTAVFLLGFAGLVFAQTTLVPFGEKDFDKSLPVEIVSDSFSINQKLGTAVFEGSVVVGQGEMRLSAARIEVEYATENGERTGKIDRMIATGGVTIVSGAEAAEAQRAIYSIKDGQIILEGNVLLTQGGNVLSGQKIVINLSDGSARIEGRVKTIFQTGGSE